MTTHMESVAQKATDTRRLISIIVPTYNRARYIEQSINSILNQQAIDDYALEVIVIDDGSNDATESIIGTLNDPRVTYLSIPHIGQVGAVRNKGLALAKGEFVAFQDSDDVWEPLRLSKQLSLFEQNSELQLVYGNAGIINSAGKKSSDLVVQPTRLKTGTTFAGLLKENVISTLTVTMRHAALERLGGFSEDPQMQVGEDYHLWLRCAAAYPKGIGYVDDSIAYHRTHRGNISKTDQRTAIEQVAYVLYQIESSDNITKKQQELVEKRYFALQESISHIITTQDPTYRPLVSVILPVYNGEKFVRTAIEGILTQTFKLFEFIIIDDGSTDSSAAIIKRYKDPRIRLIQQTNKGVPYSLNLGISMARGTYIARQDVDDISLPTRLEKELQLIMSDARIGLVGTFFTYVDEQTLEPKLTITNPTKSMDIKRSMYLHNPLGHGTVLMRRNIVAGGAGYTDTYGPTEDFELWRRIADHWEIGMVPESLYWYRLSSSGISQSKSDIQHTFTDKLRDEQWQKPFLYKTRRTIIWDGNYYKRMPSIFASQVYEQFLTHQIEIGKTMLERGWLRSGLATALGVAHLQPRAFKRFIKPALQGTIRKLRR